LCQPTKKMCSCLNYDNYADELCCKHCMQLAKVNFGIKHWLWSAFSLTMILLSLNILACTQILVTRVNELECCNFYIQLLDSALNLEVRFWQSSWVFLGLSSPYMKSNMFCTRTLLRQYESSSWAGQSIFHSIESCFGQFRSSVLLLVKPPLQSWKKKKYNWYLVKPRLFLQNPVFQMFNH